MAKGKGRKPAIDLGNRPASAADDFIRDVIRASVKKARTEIPKRAKYRRRDAAKAAMKLREKGKDASLYIKDTASKSAEWNHVNKQSGRIVKAAEKTGDKRLLNYQRSRQTVNDLKVADRMEDLGGRVRSKLGDKYGDLPMRGVNKAYSAEVRGAQQKFATARKAANPRKAPKKK